LRDEGPKTEDEQRHRALRYLYGDLSQAELERDPGLRALLAAEQRFDQLLPQGRGGGQPPPGTRGGRRRPPDLEVVALRVDRFEPATGQVSLVLDAVSQVQVEGNLKEKTVQTAPATALQSDLEPGTRPAKGKPAHRRTTLKGA
jgi:hypothetical protein